MELQPCLNENTMSVWSVCGTGENGSNIDVPSDDKIPLVGIYPKEVNISNR